MESLQTRTQKLEHKLYIEVLQMATNNQLALKNNTAYLSGLSLPAQGVQFIISPNEELNCEKPL